MHSEPAERQLQQQIANRCVAAALMFAPSVAAVITLLIRCLSGQLSPSITMPGGRAAAVLHSFDAANNSIIDLLAHPLCCTADHNLTASILSAAGHDSLGASVWLGLALWAVACIGELHIFAQPSMLILLWLAAFVLPVAYVTCRDALDGLVDESVQVIFELLHGGDCC